MRRGRYFSFVVFFALIFVLGACGSNEVKEDTATEEQSSKDTRIVEDEFGKVEIPTNPQRVAAIYLEDYLTALDVKPVD